MAAAHALRDGAAGHHGLDAESLSGFERRCLLKHICECHELIQLTILGAGAAREKAGAVADLVRIHEALKAAERLIERAERLAALQLE